MRISDWSSDVCSSDLELYLKRLIVGGLSDKVFEINRNFRNEGLSTRHNPEFTMMEGYWAYADYRDVMDLIERMFRAAAEAATGGTAVRYGEHDIDFGRPFRRASMVAPGEEANRSEEHTSELPSLIRISAADVCLEKKTQ